LIVAPSTGDIRTMEEFGDCQLHVEWCEPATVKGASQERGNSGVFLMGLYEIQVLDSFNNITYADGHAAAVYGVSPPMANALRPPGEFQAYDIVFRRPIYKDGKIVDPGHVTVFVNGVLAQDHTELEGPTGHMKRTHPGPVPEKGPLKLQDHGERVRFRNIWYRPLPPRAIEGGTDGPLSVAATMAKRREIAARIRQDAAGLKNASNPAPEMLRLMESLEYEKTDAAAQQAEQMAKEYVKDLKALPADQLGARKDEAKQVNGAFQFLANHNLLPADFPPKVELEQLVKDQRWDKK
jgi:prepilin-type processing-associated H-X9-DG protein